MCILPFLCKTGLLPGKFNQHQRSKHGSFSTGAAAVSIQLDLICLADQTHLFYAGVTGELVEGRADLAAFPLFQALGRSSVIDLTYSYYESGLGVLVQKEVSLSNPTGPFEFLKMHSLLHVAGFSEPVEGERGSRSSRLETGPAFWMTLLQDHHCS
jgi:hypothetical protein